MRGRCACRGMGGGAGTEKGEVRGEEGRAVDWCRRQREKRKEQSPKCGCGVTSSRRLRMFRPWEDTGLLQGQAWGLTSPISEAFWNCPCCESAASRRVSTYPQNSPWDPGFPEGPGGGGQSRSGPAPSCSGHEGLQATHPCGPDLWGLPSPDPGSALLA